MEWWNGCCSKHVLWFTTLRTAHLEAQPLQSSFARLYTTKYFAAGWCTTTADVLCSGSSRKPVVRCTPMVSSGCSSAKSFVWSSRLGHAGYPKEYREPRYFWWNRPRICGESSPAMPNSSRMRLCDNSASASADSTLSPCTYRYLVYSPPSNSFCVSCEAIAPMVTHDIASTSMRSHLFGSRKSEMHSPRPSRWRGNVNRSVSGGTASPCFQPSGRLYTMTSLPSPCAPKYPYTTFGSNQPAAITSSSRLLRIGRYLVSTSRP